MGFRGAIFDVDGLLVDSPHERTWRDVLCDLRDTDWRDIRDQTTYGPERFTPNVYQEVMADKPRLGGATAALTYFKVPDAVNSAEAMVSASSSGWSRSVSFAPFPTLSASCWREPPRRKTPTNS